MLATAEVGMGLCEIEGCGRHVETNGPGRSYRECRAHRGRRQRGAIEVNETRLARGRLLSAAIAYADADSEADYAAAGAELEAASDALSEAKAK